MKISDFDLFTMLARDVDAESSALFFYGIDLSDMDLCERNDGDKVLVSKDREIVIDMLVYKRIVDFLLGIFHIKKKVERAGNEMTKRVLIEEDRRKRERAQEKEFKSSLFPLISSMANSSGFKYNYEEILAMPFSQFMDAVARTQTIKATDHLALGYYSGSFDPKKFDTKKLDWTKDLDQ